MAKINLLPWRQELRKEQQRQFFTIMGLMVVLVIVAVGAVYLQYSRLINNQNNRNAYLQQHINTVEKQIKEINDLAAKKERLLARMEIIQKLQRNRPEVVRLVDELVRVMPDGVYLTSFKQQGNNLLMTGVAQSNARVSALMRNIDQSEWMTDPQLVVIQSGKNGDSRKFTLRAKQKFKTKNGKKNGTKKNKRGAK
ncbi:MAG: PilN domain-containing protein [Gammaproteobacteria bacterium]